MGAAPSALNWAVSVGTALLGCAAAFLFFARFRARVTYWL
jgi:ABC-type polysaccharide/polyol phosphate export permease